MKPPMNGSDAITTSSATPTLSAKPTPKTLTCGTTRLTIPNAMSVISSARIAGAAISIAEVNSEMEQIGLKVLHQWATLGEYDFISIIEAPDAETMARASVELGSRGTTTNHTLTAIPAEDFAAGL